MRPNTHLIRAALGVLAVFALLWASSCAIERMAAKSDAQHQAQADTQKGISDAKHEAATQAKQQANDAGNMARGHQDQADRLRPAVAKLAAAAAAPGPVVTVDRPVVLETLQLNQEQDEALKLRAEQVAHLETALSAEAEARMAERRRSDELAEAAAAANRRAEAEKAWGNIKVCGVTVVASGLVYLAWRRR